jgi:succinate dehydrogenase / fumarate reductase, cytochrome b subunit
MTWWLVAAGVSEQSFDAAQWFLGSAVGLLLLFAWSLALIFHFFSGLRHLWWDIGQGFDKPDYNRTGWGVVIATGAVTVLVWLVGLIVW